VSFDPYIFEGNHRFSEKTLHPAPPSVVGAAHLAASRWRQRWRNQDDGSDRGSFTHRRDHSRFPHVEWPGHSHVDA